MIKFGDCHSPQISNCKFTFIQFSKMNKKVQKYHKSKKLKRSNLLCYPWTIKEGQCLCMMSIGFNLSYLENGCKKRVWKNILEIICTIQGNAINDLYIIQLFHIKYCRTSNCEWLYVHSYVKDLQRFFLQYTSSHFMDIVHRVRRDQFQLFSSHICKSFSTKVLIFLI